MATLTGLPLNCNRPIATGGIQTDILIGVVTDYDVTITADKVSAITATGGATFATYTGIVNTGKFNQKGQLDETGTSGGATEMISISFPEADDATRAAIIELANSSGCGLTVAYTTRNGTRFMSGFKAGQAFRLGQFGADSGTKVTDPSRTTIELICDAAVANITALCPDSVTVPV